MLLGREEVNPNQPNMQGQTPLSYAAERGHEGVVEALLGREDIMPGKPDKYAKTPLMHATWGGHKKVIALLQLHDKSIALHAT